MKYKFRIFIRGKFNYWGFLDAEFPAGNYPVFAGIPSVTKKSGVHYTFAELQKMSEQFTGLTDVNGKDIYRGDILVRRFEFHERNYDSYMQVAWIEDRACFGLVPATPYDFTELSQEKTAMMEVAGNIHQSPKLVAQITTDMKRRNRRST